MQRDDNLRTPTRSSLATFKKTSERLPADGISAALRKERELGMSHRQLYFERTQRRISAEGATAC